MSIADRVKESIDKYNSNDLENALIQLYIAFDGTAKNEFPHIKTNGGSRLSSKPTWTSSLSSLSIRIYLLIASLGNTPSSISDTRVTLCLTP